MRRGYNGFGGAPARGAARGMSMLLILYYVFAITVIVLHYTGFLARRNLQWLVWVVAVTVIPAILFL